MDTGGTTAPVHSPRPPHLRVHRATTVARYAHQGNQHPPQQPLPPGTGPPPPHQPPPPPPPVPQQSSASTSPLHRSPPAPPSQQPRSLLAPVPQTGGRADNLPPPPPRDIASLGRDRQSRARNEYVDSPTLLAVRQNIENNNKLARNGGSGSVSGSGVHRTEVFSQHHHHASSGLTTSTGTTTSILPVPPGGSTGGQVGGRTNVTASEPQVLTTQPQSTGVPPASSGSALKKDPGATATSGTGTEEPCQESIICQQCGKCRCHACSQPRELPRRWLCHHNCELSLQKMVEVASCLCCVKAFFYHGLRDCENEDFSSDDPCACCERPHCFKRWALMGVMSVCLPCLCCYWPLRCGLSICTSCYNGCTRPGCHCRREKQPGSKRLLIDSESSST